MGTTPLPDYSALPDITLDVLVHARDRRAVAELTRRYNQRLFRTAWSILRSTQDAEEAVQDAYIRAFTSSARFDGTSSYATWLTRIVINQSLERQRNAARRARLLAQNDISDLSDARVMRENAPISHQTPEQALVRRNIARQLEAVIAQLNDTLRLVFVIREINGQTVAETAEMLGLSESAVKSRHLRARKRLQELLTPEFRSVIDETLAFAGERCTRLTQAVLTRMFSSTPSTKTLEHENE